MSGTVGFVSAVAICFVVPELFLSALLLGVMAVGAFFFADYAGKRAFRAQAEFENEEPERRRARRHRFVT